MLSISEQGAGVLVTSNKAYFQLNWNKNQEKDFYKTVKQKEKELILWAIQPVCKWYESVTSDLSRERKVQRPKTTKNLQRERNFWPNFCPLINQSKDLSRALVSLQNDMTPNMTWRQISNWGLTFLKPILK